MKTFAALQTDNDSEPGKGRTRRLRLGRLLLLIAGFTLIGASMLSASSYVEQLSPTNFQAHFEGIKNFTLLLAFAFISPRLAASVLSIAFSLYLLMYGIPKYFLSALLFAGVQYVCCIVLSRRLLAGPFKGLEDDYPETAMSHCLFFMTIFIQAFVLLCLHSFTKVNFIAFSVLCWISVLAYCRKELAALYSRLRQVKTRKLHAVKPLEPFLSVCIFAALLASALLYLYPGAIGGDSDKCYIALAKFFTRCQSILLTEPSMLKDGLRSFPYFQEIYLASGYVLDGNFGAKLFAFFIVAAKLYAVYFLATRMAGLSSFAAKALLLCYVLIPYNIEIHAVERPENIMTLFGLYLFYVLERTLISDRENRPAHSQNLIVTAAVFSCVLVSTKYTSLFLFAALLPVYWPVVLFALKNLFTIIRKAWPLLAVSFGVAVFWYLRNIILWGELVSHPPYGKYHLTIFFPPLRSFADFSSYLQDALIHTSTYTEFDNLGYGLVGVVFWGGTLIALLAPGVPRRLALVTLLYALLLVNSTRQTRYLLPVIPLGLTACFALLSLTLARIRPRIGAGLLSALVFSAVLVQLLITMGVHLHSNVGHVFRDRISLREKNMEKIEPLYSIINDKVQYPNMVLTSHFDGNYSVDASLLRADPLAGLGKLAAEIKKHKPSHFLLAAPGVDPTILFFNDVGFFEAIADHSATAFAFELYEYNPQKFNRLLAAVEQRGWDIDTTYLISDKLFHLFPSDYVIGEAIELPGTHGVTLYRVDSMLWNGASYRHFAKSETFIAGEHVAWYFEDMGSNGLGAKNLKAQKTVESLNRFSESGVEQVSVPAGSRGTLKYSISLDGVAEDELIAEIYVRLVSKGSGAWLNVAGVRSLIPPFGDVRYWRRLSVAALKRSSQNTFDIEFELENPEARIQDIRVLLRKPHTRKAYLPLSRAELGLGLEVVDSGLDWFSEDFTDVLRTSDALDLSTEREDVRADKVRGRMYADAENGSKRYTFSVQGDPKLAKTFKLYMDASFCDSAEQSTLDSRVSGTYADGSTKSCGELDISKLNGEGRQHLADCPFPSSSQNPLMQVTLDVSLQSADCAWVSELIGILGVAKQ